MVFSATGLVTNVHHNGHLFPYVFLCLSPDEQALEVKIVFYSLLSKEGGLCEHVWN